jgi:hypothetical protein
VIYWALNTLSALKFVHSHSVAFGDIDLDETCWLSADLSLLLLRFIESTFCDPERNEIHESRIKTWRICNVKTDLFAWASLLCILLTKKPGVQNIYNNRRLGGPSLRENRIPDLSVRANFDEVVGDDVRKCFTSAYDTAEELWTEFEIFMRRQGHGVGNYGLLDFDPNTVLNPNA